jgi:hypothetical protein
VSGLCETCRHWTQVEEDWQYDKLVMGKCGAIRQREDIIEPARRLEDWDAMEAEENRLLSLEKAIAVDGSGYYAAVRCRGDFGCVLHEPASGSEPLATSPQTADPEPGIPSQSITQQVKTDG